MLNEERWPHRDHWMTRVAILDKSVPDKYCWTGLATLALYGVEEDRETQNEGIRCAESCRLESANPDYGHSCYCGKFKNGALVKEPPNDHLPPL